MIKKNNYVFKYLVNIDSQIFSMSNDILGSLFVLIRTLPNQREKEKINTLSPKVKIKAKQINYIVEKKKKHLEISFASVMPKILRKLFRD